MRKPVMLVFLPAILVCVLCFHLISYSNTGATEAALSRGAIKVPATMVWANPGQPRDYDQLILAANNEPLAWAEGMNTAMRLWLVGQVETMLLYGEQVVILAEQEGWVQVAAPGHRIAADGRGYPGWIPAAHVATNDNYLANVDQLPAVAVKKPFAGVYEDIQLTKRLHEASYMVTLPLLKEYQHSLAVSLPDGNVGYLSREAVKRTAGITFSPEEIVAEARQFLGLDYIWAGTGAYGFDCSGLTMRLYQSQGINIPRDADEQAWAGTAVQQQDLQPGDLVFYARWGEIYHVGMYIGDGLMIHAPNSSSAVQIDGIADGFYSNNIWGYRRYA